jgi:hypothetical protein
VVPGARQRVRERDPGRDPALARGRRHRLERRRGLAEAAQLAQGQALREADPPVGAARRDPRVRRGERVGRPAGVEPLEGDADVRLGGLALRARVAVEPLAAALRVACLRREPAEGEERPRVVRIAPQDRKVIFACLAPAPEGAVRGGEEAERLDVGGIQLRGAPQVSLGTPRLPAIEQRSPELAQAGGGLGRRVGREVLERAGRGRLVAGVEVQVREETPRPGSGRSPRPASPASIRMACRSASVASSGRSRAAASRARSTCASDAVRPAPRASSSARRASLSAASSRPSSASASASDTRSSALVSSYATASRSASTAPLASPARVLRCASR